MTKQVLRTFALSATLIAGVGSVQAASSLQQLDASAAAQVAAQLGTTLDGALSNGSLQYNPAGQTYFFSEDGADEYVAAAAPASGGSGMTGGKLYAGLTAKELTALVAGGLAFALVLMSDEDPGASTSSSSSSSSR